MGFVRDLARGKLGEQTFVNWLSQYNIPSKKIEGVSGDIQFDINGKTLTAEVKYDEKSLITGNIAIEYMNSRKNALSGILSSLANFWIYVLPYEGSNTIWCADRLKLLQFVTNTKPFRIFENAGDGNANIFLYKKDNILNVVFQPISQEIFLTYEN